MKRHLSLSLAIAPIEVGGHKINLIDTPGYLDFVADVHAALRVADLAVFVVSAVEGVEVGTEVAWRLAEVAGGEAAALPIYISANMPGAMEHNAGLVARYRTRNPHL